MKAANFISSVLIASSLMLISMNAAYASSMQCPDALVCHPDGTCDPPFELVNVGSWVTKIYIGIPDKDHTISFSKSAVKTEALGHANTACVYEGNGIIAHAESLDHYEPIVHPIWKNAPEYGEIAQACEQDPSTCMMKQVEAQETSSQKAEEAERVRQEIEEEGKDTIGSKNWRQQMIGGG